MNQHCYGPNSAHPCVYMGTSIRNACNRRKAATLGGNAACNTWRQTAIHGGNAAARCIAGKYALNHYMRMRFGVLPCHVFLFSIRTYTHGEVHTCLNAATPLMRHCRHTSRAACDSASARREPSMTSQRRLMHLRPDPIPSRRSKSSNVQDA